MFIKYIVRGVIPLLVATTFYPQISAAEKFTSADFLKWSKNNQNGYFQATIGMAGMIAHANDEKQARCIERWYFEDQEKSGRYILDAMQRFPEYHPRGVIAAVLEKHCGSFKFR